MITWVQLFGGPVPKKFRRAKTSKIRGAISDNKVTTKLYLQSDLRRPAASRWARPQISTILLGRQYVSFTADVFFYLSVSGTLRSCIFQT